MANRNTRIRGIQILDGGVGTTQLANDSVDKDKINADIAGDGLAQNVDGSLEINAGDGVEISADNLQLDLKSGGGLKIDTAELTVEPNDFAGTGLKDDGSDNLEVDLQEVAEVVMAVADDYVVLLDGGISGDTKKEKFADIMTAIAGTGLTATSGVLSVDEHSSGIITEDDIIRNEVVSPDTGSDTVYTLANTPVANSVNVYLNGLLQQPGAGEDYTISGSTITFAEAVDAASLVIADYIIT